MTENKLLLLGCGILKKEARHLIEKNKWPMDSIFLDSELHNDFNKFSKTLISALAKHQHRNIIVLYGCCHPLMDKILKKGKTFRTPGQNCVDLVLGNELFAQELSKGAFFLFEEWARRWENLSGQLFGNNLKIAKDIFQNDRKYMLGLRTPCSKDFKTDADKVGRMVGLPIRWMDVTLDHLESVLQTAITQKIREMPCRR